MKKVISIKNINGESIPLEKLDIFFIGEDYVLAKFKDYGFLKNFHKCDGYTVVIEEN